MRAAYEISAMSWFACSACCCETDKSGEITASGKHPEAPFFAEKPDESSVRNLDSTRGLPGAGKYGDPVGGGSGRGLEERPEVVLDSGDRYAGQWCGDQRHGVGKITTPEGGRYSGEFRNDQANGSGKFIHPNGDEYNGQWLDNK